MVKLPKTYYTIMLLALVLVLTGCELRRDSGEMVDPGPVSDLPPTLAPLGAETELIEDTTASTTLNAQPTATESTLAAGEAAENSGEPTLPTSEAVELTGEPSNSGAGEIVTISENSATAASGAEAAAIEQSAATEEAIIVDASEDLPMGGPVASNPPAGQAESGYNAPAEYGELMYTVRPGDTLFNIAQRFGSSVDTITYANGLTSDMINVGQVLNIPGGNPNAYQEPAYQQPPAYQDPAYSQQPTYQDPAYSQQPTYQDPAYQQQPTYQDPAYSQQPYVLGANDVLHTVTPGETLFRVSQQYGTSVEAIAAANRIADPYIIHTGQRLIVPEPGSAYNTAPAGGYYEQQQQPYAGSGSGYSQQQPYAGDGYGQQAPTEDYYAPQDPNYYQQPQAPANGYYPPQDNYYPGQGGVAGTHTVSPGETLYSVAARYGTSAEALAASNGLVNPNQIFVGQVLYLP